MKFLRSSLPLSILAGSALAALAQETVDFGGNAAIWTSQMNSNLQALQQSVGPTLGANARDIDALQNGTHSTALALSKAGSVSTYGASLSNAPTGTMTPLSGPYGLPMQTPVLGMAGPGGGASALGIAGINGLPIGTNSVLPYLITMLPAELLGAVPMLASSYASQPTSAAVNSQTAANLGTAPPGTVVGDGAVVRTLTPNDVAYMTALRAGTPQAMQEFLASSSASSGMIYHPLTGTPVPINALGSTAAPASTPAPGTTTGTPSARLSRRPSGPLAFLEGALLSLGRLPSLFVSTAHAQTSFLPGAASSVLGLPAGGTPSNMGLVSGLSAGQMARYQNFLSESNAAITTNQANASINNQILAYLQSANAQLAAMQAQAAALRQSLTQTNAIPHVTQIQRSIQDEQVFVQTHINQIQAQINVNNQALHGLLVQRNVEYQKYAALAQAEAGSKQAAILSSLNAIANQQTAGMTASPEMMPSGALPSTPAY